MSSRIGRNVLVGLALGFAATAASAQISVPLNNGSFEQPPLPKGTQGNPFVTGWNTPGPVLSEFPPGSGLLINTNAGAFPNDPDKDNNGTTDPDFITNSHGDGAQDFDNVAFLGALSGNEFWQQAPSHSIIGGGRQYTLTVGVAHNFGGGNPAFQPDPLSKVTLALFYLDAANARHLLASRDVFKGADGLSPTLLKDFSATTLALADNDPAVGRPLVVSILSTNAPANTGGFFDLDNVRVTMTPEPGGCMVLTIATALVGGLRRRRPRA